MRLRAILLVLASFCASAALAQTVTMGNEYVPHQAWTGGTVEGSTYIDLVRPATADGMITNAAVAYDMWADRCPDAFTIKFCRLDGNSVTVFAERGPFDASVVSELTEITLSPPVQVWAGDLIGVTQLRPDLCGGTIVLSNVPGGEYLASPDDIKGTVSLSSVGRVQGTLGLRAWGGGVMGYTARIIPVVGSAMGWNGSRWRTDLQLLNPHQVTATGRLVFRSALGTEDDASLPYSIPAGATQTIPDVVTAMGRSGLGSIDVVIGYSDEGLPVILAHVLHDRGDGTEVGMTEEAIDPRIVGSPCWESAGTHILRPCAPGHLIAPAEGADKRLNLGVRTLGDGATINFILHAADGAALQTVPRTWPPDHFQQLRSTEIFGVLTGGESIEIAVLQGSAIVYGVTIDNATNDQAIQLAEGMMVVLAGQ